MLFATRLSAQERAVVMQAQREAFVALSVEVTAPVDDLLRVQKGLSSSMEPRALLGATARSRLGGRADTGALC